MSATLTVSADSQTRPRIVIAGAGPAAQALVRQLTRTQIGPVRLAGLVEGRMRQLTAEEIGTLLDAGDL